MPGEDSNQNNSNPTTFNQGHDFPQQGENLNSTIPASPQYQTASLVENSETKQNLSENIKNQPKPPSETTPKQEPFSQTTNPVSNASSPLDSTVTRDDKNQKAVLFLSVLFFIFSLIGLSFYFFSGIAEGRFSLVNLFSGRQQVATPAPTSAISSKTPTPEPVTENLVYTDDVISFEYPQGMSVVKKTNLWLVSDISLKKTTESDDVVLEISLVSGVKEAPSDYLVNEVIKTDKKLTKNVVENLVSNEKIGDYEVFFYKLADSSIIYVFKEDMGGKIVKIVDFSYKLGSDLSKNLAEEVIPTIYFIDSSTKQLLSPSVIVSPTPSTSKFNLEE